MTYVDGFVIVVPKGKIETYRAMSEKAGKIWMEYGALQYVECVGDDLADKGMCGNFVDLAKPGADDTVVFSYIVYKSREHRDEVNAKVMADERINESCKEGDMPFDPKRMAYGGFKAIVEF